MPKLLYRIEEAQKILSFGRSKIYELIKEKHLVLHSRGRITAKSIEVYAEKENIKLKEPLA